MFCDPCGKKILWTVPFDIARMCWLIEKLGGTPPLGEVEAKGPKSQVVLGCSVGFVRINGLFHLLINGVYCGYNPFY